MSDGAVAAAYDARAEEYVALLGDVGQMAVPDRELIAGWRDQTVGALLDAGCGPGHWAELLRVGDRDVLGIDLSEGLLARARSRHPRVRFEVASMRALPVQDAAVGGILAWYSLIHLRPEDLPAVLAEFARVLVPGGSLLLGYFAGERVERFEHVVHPAYLWSDAALSALVADAGFTVESHQRRERDPSEASTRPHGSLIATRL